MSPITLRRHRAERLLRDQFHALRGEVLTSVRGRLRAAGVSLDQGDLEGCYSQAWQGLYMALLEGEEITNPGGWLVLVTYRRALDEHRAHTRARCHAELGLDGGSGVDRRAARVGEAAPAAGAIERDLASELDDRARLRQLFEGLRHRLDAREREAAALCYLQGYSRAQAAEHLGVSEVRMRKLMEGRGSGRPGVAGKMGALVRTISDGGWCEEQGSLMRALAYGVLDPAGERHALALAHSSQCPACRAYVVSLRGLAVALPPVFLPGSVAAAVLARAGLQAGRGIGGGASASGAAGAAGAAGAGGAAGGGWLIGAGPFGAKLAVGCLLALGVGAGCVAIEGAHRVPSPRRTRHVAARSRPSTTVGSGLTYGFNAALTGTGGPTAAGLAAGRAASASAALTPAARARREFGPEQALLPPGAESPTASAASAGTSAKSAASGSRGSASNRRAPGSTSSGGPVAQTEGGIGRSGEPASAGSGGQSASSSPPSPSSGDSTAAQREFSPG